jgi:hypothetical protein
MRPEDFVQAGKTLYGRRWRAGLAEELEMGTATVWRYAKGRYPIPRKVELAVEGLLARSKKRKPLEPRRDG